MISRLERLCLDKGLKMTEQRRVIARVLSASVDHPDVEQVYRRATAIDPSGMISAMGARDTRKCLLPTMII